MAGSEEGAAGAWFAGRERELARAAGLLDEARAGRGRLVLCTGEAGIGKTRLAEESAAVAAARGCAVAWARSADRDSSPPYGLWRLVLQELPGGWPGGQGDASRLDLWSLVFGTEQDRAVVSGSELDRAQRFALFGEVRQRLARAAEPEGLLLVLDDIQWADEPSLLLLVHLARQLRGLRILVMAACREPTPLGSRDSQTIGALAADADTERIALTGLPADAVAELLASAGQAGPREQADKVCAETSGNPFLIRELVRMRAEQPGAAPGTIPGAVLHATSHRIAQLGPASQDVLRAAAVAGTSFSVGVVALMLGTAALALLDPVDECQAAGFLTAGDHPGEYRFSHALVRSAVVARLSATDKVLLHNAAADAIERFYSGQLRSHRAELAYHRVRGSLPGDRARAARACETAGDVAAQDLAFEEAARLYRQALSVGQGELLEADRGRLELAVAGALYRSGDLPGWHRTVAGVARRAERRSDHLLLALAGLEMEATGYTEWDSEICRICEQALAGPELGGALRARVLARLAQALAYREEYQRAAETSRAALDAAEADGSPAAIVDALHARQLASGGPDGTAERADVAVRMLEVASSARDAWAELWGRIWRVHTLFETGRLAVIPRELTGLAASARRAHGPLARWHLLEYSAAFAHATGRYADAVRIAGEAYAVSTDMGHPMAFGNYGSILCPIAMHIGFDASGATALLTQMPAHIAPGGSDAGSSLVSVFPQLNLALVWLEQGDRERAARAYGQAGPVCSWRPLPAFLPLAWAQGLAVAIALQKTGDVAYLAERLGPLRGRHVANSAGAGAYLGPVELHLGKAAASLGAIEAAAGDLETAAGICDAIGAPGFAVEARVELAAALTRRGMRADRDRALAVLAAAAPEAERLGMAPFRARIDDLRDRLAPAVPPVQAPLSPREQEVALLVGKGMTNRQIAEALYLSERTAQNHVQHILAKLGFSNRSQIAAWASAAPVPASQRPAAG